MGASIKQKELLSMVIEKQALSIVKIEKDIQELGPNNWVGGRAKNKRKKYIEEEQKWGEGEEEEKQRLE